MKGIIATFLAFLPCACLAVSERVPPPPKALVERATSEIAFDFSAVKVSHVLHVIYGQAMKSPFVLSPEVLQDERLVTFRFISTEKQLRPFLNSFLDSLGMRVRGTWQDTYTARKRVYPDGQCVVTVTKDKSFVGPAQIRPKAKRGESEERIRNEEDAGRRARQKVRDCCKAISADRMVTLTYRENMQDREKALRHWKEFCRRVGKVNKFHYVAVIEIQERGAIHFHVAVRGRQCYALLRSIWQRVVGFGDDGRKMAQVHVRDPHSFGFGVRGAHRLASYIAKYCGKQMDCRELDQKRYFRSRGIVLPDLQYWRLPNCTCMLDAVHAAFRMIEGHSMENLDTWCNNAIGVVYLATAPGIPTRPECPF